MAAIGVFKMIGNYLASNKMKMAGGIVNTGFAISDYRDNKQAGDSTFTAAASAVGDLTMMAVMGPWRYLGTKALLAAPGLVMDGVESAGQYSRSLEKQSRNTAFSKADFIDTEQTAGMRKAGQILSKRGSAGIQQALVGQEARYM